MFAPVGLPTSICFPYQQGPRDASTKRVRQTLKEIMPVFVTPAVLRHPRFFRSVRLRQGTGTPRTSAGGCTADAVAATTPAIISVETIRNMGSFPVKCWPGTNILACRDGAWAAGKHSENRWPNRSSDYSVTAWSGARHLPPYRQPVGDTRFVQTGGFGDAAWIPAFAGMTAFRCRFPKRSSQVCMQVPKVEVSTASAPQRATMSLPCAAHGLTRIRNEEMA